jgi:uncharacterized phiE125 gp8 family phage protein
MTKMRTVPPSALPVTIDAARANLRIDGDHMDAQITGWIRGIVAELEHLTGQCLMAQTWTVVLDAFPTAPVSLPHPVISVSSVKYLDMTGTEQTLAQNTYRINRKAYSTTVAPIVGGAWPDTYAETGAVVLTCVCGYGADASATPDGAAAYILAKLELDHGPRAAYGDNEANARRLAGMLDGLMVYA